MPPQLTPVESSHGDLANQWQVFKNQLAFLHAAPTWAGLSALLLLGPKSHWYSMSLCADHKYIPVCFSH